MAPSEDVGSDEGDFDQDIDSPSPEKTRSNLSGKIVKDYKETHYLFINTSIKRKKWV